jgi:tetratricopeptide (TPR) repeat protein
VLVKLASKVTVAVLMGSLLGVLPSGQAQQKQWKDRAEYDLFEAARKEQDPKKKLDALNTWKQKYAATDYEEERLLMFTQTYQQLGEAPQMYDSALALLAKNPMNIQGLYFITTLTTSMGDTAPAKLANGEKYAKALLEAIGTLKKPDNMADDAWNKELDALRVVAHTTLGWVAMQRKNHAAAEDEFRRVLKMNANNGQVSYWLATVIIAQRDPDKQSEAFFHFARAGHFAGEGAMPPEGRKQVAGYLSKIYTTFHGDESGLDELIAMARKSAFPPPGLKIKSKEEIAFEKEEELKKKDPELALWLNLKKLLTGPEGEQYFANSMRNTKVTGLRGYLVSANPPDRPNTLVLALSERGGRGEVTLVLDEPYRYSAPRGTTLRFEGVARSLSQEPFMLTFEVEQGQIQGWPPPPARKTTR